jgi:hypothetical protein
MSIARGSSTLPAGERVVASDAPIPAGVQLNSAWEM